jgi:hypothetical protein
VYTDAQELSFQVDVLRVQVQQLREQLDVVMAERDQLDVVICLAWLGLDAPAWAWLGRALASLFSSQSPSRRGGLGLAWLWLKPGLSSYFPNVIHHAFIVAPLLTKTY